MTLNTAKIDSSGRVLLPAAFRRALDLKAGDDVILTLTDEDELRLLPTRVAIRRAQEIVRRYVPPDISLSNELIQERRAEAHASTGASLE